MITVADLPQRDERRVRFAADAVDEAGQRYRLQLSDYQLREWPSGSRWRVAARIRPPVGEVNPAGFNREAWALAGGIGGIHIDHQIPSVKSSFSGTLHNRFYIFIRIRTQRIICSHINKHSPCRCDRIWHIIRTTPKQRETEQ